MRDLHPCPPCGRQGRPGEGVPGRLEYRRAAGERPPRARPQRRGSPGPIPNPAVKPAFAESTAAQGCGRAGRRARGGRFSIRARRARRCAPEAPHAPKARRGIVPLRACLRLRDAAASRAARAVKARRAISFAGLSVFRGRPAVRGAAHTACAEVPQRRIPSAGLSAF